MNKLLRVSYLFVLFLLIAGITRAQVVANFTASPTSGCAPLVVYFTNTSTGNISNYAWNFGNSTTSTIKTPSTTYTSPGTYPVSLTVSGPGGTHTKSNVMITVYPPPTVSFTFNNAAGCAPHAVQFSSSVTPNSPGTAIYNWDFGDGSNASGASPSHIYTTGGIYTVSLTVTSGAGCPTTVIQSNIITVYPKPVSTFSTAQTLNCSLPAMVYFSNSVTGSGPFSISWTFGDGSPGGSGANPSHLYTTAGSYTVTMLVTDSKGCKDSVVQNAYITTQPNTASFTGPAQSCDSATATFTNTTVGAGATTWDFGDGSPPEPGATASHYYTAPGSYNVTMVTGLGPCSDTVIHSILINPKPVVAIAHDTPCPAPTIMQFKAKSNIPGASYQWSWKSGGTSSLANPTHAYSISPQIDTATLILTTAAGCTDTVVMDTVFVREIVVAAGASPVNGGCAPLNFTFFVDLRTIYPIPPRIPISKPYPFPITSYSWNIDGVATSALASPSYTFTTRGVHFATVTVTTANGCTVTGTATAPVGIKHPPSFTGGPTPVCVKTLVSFTNTTVDSTLTYIWDYGEPDSNIGNYHGANRYDVPGTYSIKLVSIDNGCKDTLIRPDYITILPGNAMFRDSIYCAPSTTVAFTDTSIGASTHLWWFGDGTTSPLASPTHTYPLMGDYYATHITSNTTNGCRDTVQKLIALKPSIIGITATDTTLCKGDTLKIHASYTGLPIDKWTWKINDYASPVYDKQPFGLPDTSVIYQKDTFLNTTGYYTASVIVRTRDYRCVDSVRKNNYVIVSHPAAKLGASPLLGCTPMPVTFTDSSVYTPGTQPANRLWKFGNGDTASNNTLSTIYTYLNASIYTVKLRVTDWIGCSDSIIKVGYIEARHPTASFYTSSRYGCIGQPFTFINLSHGATTLSYKWSFGDGDTSISLGPTHSYKAAGTYSVRLIVTDSTGCRDTSLQTAYIIITRPTAAFTLSDTLAICPPLIVNFSSTSANAASSIWNFGNGGSSVITNPVSTFSAPGIYTVRLIVVDLNGCPDTATARVRVLGYAGALSYTPLIGCVPLQVGFTANITNVPSLVWDFSDGVTQPATGTTTSHTYLTPGAYVPKLIFSDGTGCSAASVGLDTIKVDAVTAGFKVLPPCEKTLLQFIDTSRSFFSPIKTSRWDFGGAGIATGSPVQRTYLTAGSYTVTLISTNASGCADTITSDITINPLPRVVAIDDTAVCIPDAITLSVTGALSYAWSSSATLSCSACPGPVVSPVAPSVYVVTGTDINGCAAKDTVRVGIQTKATFVTSGSGEICLGQHYRLFAAGATIYNWTPPGTLDDPGIANPVASPLVTTTYIVTAQEGSCQSDTHMVRVIVRPLPVLDAGSDLRVVAGKSVLLQVSGTGITRVAWADDASLSCFSCYAPEARPKVSTTYRVTAYNEYGCTATDSVRVLVLCDGSQLFIPNTFTPNGDGVNDYFFARGQGIDHVNFFRVYSRWGELLYERGNIMVNDEQSGWNGTHGGRILNPDVYVYVIEATCDTGEPITFKGDVTLMR